MNSAVRLLSAVVVVGLAGLSSSDEDVEQIDQRPADQRQQGQVQTMDDALAYLGKHGYNFNNMEDGLSPSGGSKFANLRHPDSTHAALRAFQRMAGLNVTGELDSDTLHMMNVPRCGVPDFGTNDWSKRRKRFLIQGRRWRRNALTFSLSRFQRNSLPASRQRAILKRAFDVWAKVTPLTFTERPANENVDIEIKFVRGAHGDGGSFDGPGRTLAHAFFPGFGLGGDAHFDSDEFFTEGMRSGVNLFQVAAHEFGHSLGLGHSSDQRALMAAFYRGYQPNFRLHQDDISGIQRLYGANQQGPLPTSRRPTFRPQPTNRPAPPTRLPPGPPNLPPGPPNLPPGPPNLPPGPPNLPGVCANARFDALFTHARFGTFGFRGDELLKLTDTGIEAGYPRPIRSTFPEFNTVDAALALDVFFTNSRSSQPYVFLFEGTRIIGYDLQSMRVRYNNMGQRSSLFFGLPGSIDAIFRWSGNGRIYAMKGNLYYRLNSNGLRVDRGYPRPLAAWNLPVPRVEAALQYENRRTYFFSGQQYYRFNDRGIRPDDSYPRSVGLWWLGCRPNNLETGNVGAAPVGSAVESDEAAAADDQITDVETVYEQEQRKATATAPPATALSSKLVALSVLLINLIQNLV